MSHVTIKPVFHWPLAAKVLCHFCNTEWYTDFYALPFGGDRTSAVLLAQYTKSF